MQNKLKINLFSECFLRYWVLAVSLGVMLSGCASVSFDAPKTTSYAFTDTADTHLGRSVVPAAAEHPGESGFFLLIDGLDALAARLLLSTRAERSIDAQYYLLLDDVTGHLFAASLLKAADRGVRVRLILDDITTPGYDAGMAAFDSHPNIEIRVFNPFSRSRGRVLSGATEFRRINRRMHNKSMTFDNQITIVGGRNIGAEYFSARDDNNYADLDVIGVGPVAQDVSAAFDEYWNSPVAVPVSQLVSEKTLANATANLEERRADIPQMIENAKDTPYGGALRSAILDTIEKDKNIFTWSKATVVADPPKKADEDYQAGDPEQLSSVMGPVVRGAQKNLLVVSAYFVPGDNGTTMFRELAERGVNVTIVTNSLAANDVVPVHSGYARYRKALLEAGVELWEVRVDPGRRKDRQKRGLGYSQSSLHTKAFIVDSRYMFVGSFNWDPRSVNINTEMGVNIDSPEMAGPILERVKSVLPESAYRLRLNDAGDIEWIGWENGQEVVFTNEPDASFGRRFSSGFYGILPIEGQL